MALPVGARRQVDEALRSSGLYERARAILKDAASTGRDIFGALREEGLVDDMATVLLEAGVDPATLQKVATAAPALESEVTSVVPSSPAVDRTARSVPPRQLSSGHRSTAAAATRMDPGKPMLCIRFGKGKAFLPPAALAGDIAVSSSARGGGGQASRRRGDGDADDGAHSDGDDLDSSAADVDAAIALEAASGVRRAYVLHAFCAGQRFQSVPVPVSLEPDFAAANRVDAASAAEAVASAASAAAASADAMASVAATYPQFAVDLQPVLEAGPSPALRRNGGFVASSGAAGAAHAALPLARRLLHSTSLEASGLHLVLTMVTDHRAAATAALAASHAPDSPSRRSGAGAGGGATSRDDDAAAGADAAASASLASAAATSADVSVDVIASHTLDWRTVVAAAGGMMTTLVPLSPAGPGPHPTTADGTGARIPVGLLPVHLALRPLLAPHDTLPRFDAEHILSRSLSVHRDVSQAFVSHARSFWSEYKAAHPSFRSRPVKIFGESERGETLPVPAYVTPMAAGRLLESPFAAARFVSLLPYRRDDSIAGGGAAASRELWHAPHVTLSLRQGDAQAHALLLCSLLLGFGLEAYMALGTRIDAGTGAEAEYAWVVTRYASAAAPAALSSTGGPESPGGTASAAAGVSARVCFWDALTGQRSEPGSPSPAGSPHYHRLAAVFNHECYFANQALDDSVAAVRWADWGDVSQWKAVSLSPLVGLFQLFASLLLSYPPRACGGLFARSVALLCSCRFSV